MKIKSSELKKLINEAIITEKKALIKEGYSQGQLDEIDFSKVGNFFKGAARGVKDLASDTKKNYFDNTDLNLESEINKLSKRREISSQKVAEAQGKLSELKSELSGINKSIREKTLQLNKIKKEKMGNSSFKKYSNQDRYSNEKKAVPSNTNSKQVSTSKGNKQPIDLNRDASTYEDPKAGVRFRRKLQEVQMRTDLRNKMVRLCEKGDNCNSYDVVNSFPYSTMISNMSKYKGIDFSRIHKDDLTFELCYAWLELNPNDWNIVPKKYEDDMRIFKMCFDKGGISLLTDKDWTFEQLKYIFDRDGGFKGTERAIIKILANSSNYLNKEQYVYIAKLIYKLVGEEILNHIPRAYRDLVKDSNTDSRIQKLKALSTPFRNQKGNSQTNQTELLEVQMGTDLTNYNVQVNDNGEKKEIPYHKLLNYGEYSLNQIVNKDDITYELAYKSISRSPKEYLLLPEKFKSNFNLFKLYHNLVDDSLYDIELKDLTFDMIKYAYSSDKDIHPVVFNHILDKLVKFTKAQFIEIARLAYKKHGDRILEFIPRQYQELLK